MFDDRLKKLREARHLTQIEVANNIGVTQKAYSHYEKNVRTPSPEILIKLCVFYGVTSDYLLGIKKDHSNDTLSSERSAVEKLLRQCSDEELLNVRDYLKFLIWRRGEH